MEYNIIIAGVGGQGVVTLGSLIAEAAMDAGLNVVMSEIHGLSQRGGSVSVDVRIGDVRSPIIPDGSADLIIGLEGMEGFRMLGKARPSTLLLVNSRRMTPVYLSMRGKEYPDLEKMAKASGDAARIVFVDAETLAREAGSEKAAGTALLGVVLVVHKIPVSESNVNSAISSRFSGRTLVLNHKALGLGMKYGAELLKESNIPVPAGKP